MDKWGYKLMKARLACEKFKSEHNGISLYAWVYVKIVTGKFPNELSGYEMKKFLIENSDYAKRKLGEIQ